MRIAKSHQPPTILVAKEWNRRLFQTKDVYLKKTVMLAVHGIYDGKTVKITDRITEKKRYKVVVTFIEEIQQSDYDLRDFSAQTTGLDFWEDSKEDIYQDYVTPKSNVK